MTLMHAAQAMGLASGPMIGCDPAQVDAGFGLCPDEVPALRVTVGTPAPGQRAAQAAPAGGRGADARLARPILPRPEHEIEKRGLPMMLYVCAAMMVLVFGLYRDRRAVLACCLPLTVGVATWAFSELKFQADMVKLPAFMFMVNMVMAMTTLPAVAVLLERLFPRRRPVRANGLQHH